MTLVEVMQTTETVMISSHLVANSKEAEGKLEPIFALAPTQNVPLIYIRLNISEQSSSSLV